MSSMVSEKDGTERPQCTLCSKVFSNANLKPSKLKEHFDNRHEGAKSGNDLNTLKIKMARFHQSNTLEKHGILLIDKRLLHVSCKVAFLLTKKKQVTHISRKVSENLRNGNGKIITRARSRKKLSLVPLSHDIITSRIRGIRENILEQVIADVKASPIKVILQLDESTDVSLCSQLLVFVRYVKEKKVVEEFLWCEPLKTTTKAVDVFNIVKEFFLNHECLLIWLAHFAPMERPLCSEINPALLPL